MSRIRLLLPAAVAACIAYAGHSQAAPDQPAYAGTPQQIIDQVVDDVVGRRVRQAQEEVRRRTQIDPWDRGYDPGREYEAPATEAPVESRRELDRLDSEHDRTLSRLEEELERKLQQAQDEFEREAEREDKPEKIASKRRKLEEKVDRAFAKYNRKMDDETRRFDKKREHILAKARGGSEEKKQHKDRGDSDPKAERKERDKDRGKDKQD